MKKILFIILSTPFFLFASDEQLSEIIKLLRYEDNSNPDAVSYYTMSDFLGQKQKTTPFVEHYFRGNPSVQSGNSYNQFMHFLSGKSFQSPDDFSILSFEDRQKLFFEFYQQQVVNFLTDDFSNSYNFDIGTGYVNPLMMATMSLSKIALSSGSGGSSGKDEYGRDLFQVLNAIEMALNSSEGKFNDIYTALNYTKINSENLPILDITFFEDWSRQSPENLALRSTNKLAAIVAALKSAYDDKISNYGDLYMGEITPDFISGYSDILAAQDRINGGGVAGGGGLDNETKNHIRNISTNSISVVDILKKILEQISKMQTNQSSIADSIYWMTNNFPDEVGGVLPPGSGGGSSNDVWNVWDVFANNTSGNPIRVPSIVWDEIEVNGERVLFPRYDDPEFQPSQKYGTFWQEYQNLLVNAKAGSIDGQEFLTGVEIFSMRFLADISSQLMILNSHIPSKTNLWDDVKDLVDNKIPQEINALESQINGERSKIETLNRVDSVSKFVQPITKVKTAISKLKPTSNDRVIRIPLPNVLAISGDDWVIDLEEINGYPSLRRTIRFICALIYTLLFIRTLIVPCMILICLGVRLMDSSLGLLFFDDTTSVKIVGEWTANAFDIFCHLIGLDTDFKKWAVGIKT